MHHFSSRYFTLVLAMIAGLSVTSFFRGPPAGASAQLSSMEEAVVNQATKINTVNTMSPSVADPALNCPTCKAPTAADIEFMECKRENSYLNDDIAKVMKSPSPLWKEIFSPVPDATTYIKPICIRKGMESHFNERSKSFRECSSSARAVSPQSKKVLRPCINEDYFKLVTKSFNLVTQCMKVGIHAGESEEEVKKDALAVYSLISVESGFHVNAMSGTGAGGIGQVTDDAITYINNHVLPVIRTNLQASSSDICKMLDREILSEPMKADGGNNCDRIAISKGNPLKNMVYTYANIYTSKQQISEDLFEDEDYADKFDLSATEKADLLRQLAVWSHNTGVSGIVTPARATLAHNYAGKKVKSVSEFMEFMKTNIRVYPAKGRDVLITKKGKKGKKITVVKRVGRGNSTPSRILETSQYYPRIQETLHDIEDNVDGKTCLN
jgi:hypothetical protein